MPAAASGGGDKSPAPRYPGPDGNGAMGHGHRRRAAAQPLVHGRVLAAGLKPGGLKRQMLLGEPVMLGRTKDGQAFALRDICPHRGVPLSAGRMMDDRAVECPYHGWRFRTDGVCSMIPSLVEGQDLDPAKIQVRAYPLREQDGLIWVYMAAEGQENVAPAQRAAQGADRQCQAALVA